MPPRDARPTARRGGRPRRRRPRSNWPRCAGSSTLPETCALAILHKQETKEAVMAGINRRTLMTGAASLLALPAVAAEPDAFRIGGIVSFSGAYGIIGQSMCQGVEIAVQERGGTVLGKPIVVQWEDDETKPQVAVQKATRLLSSNVQMFFGAIISASTLAIMKLAEQRKIPVLVTASADDRITGTDKSRYAFRTSGNSYSENMSVVQHLKSSGVKAVYGVAADYNVMRDGWSLVKQQLGQSGIAVAGEDFPPVGAGDYAVIVDKVRQSGAQAVVVLLTGNDGITFVKQAGAVGLNDKVRIDRKSTRLNSSHANI